MVSPRPGNKYASGFELLEDATGRYAVVYSPWNKREMARYPLAFKITRLAVTSCTHVGFMSALGCADSLVAVCDPALVYTDLSHCKGVQEGVLDIGSSMSPSLERIVLAHPDALMASSYSAEDTSIQPLLTLGIPVIFNYEWMEQHPLARAEWVRFVGALMGRESEADSLFLEVESRYLAVRAAAAKSAAETTVHPSVVSGQDFRGTWYVPSGNTYMGCFFRDAHADYRYVDNMHEGSIPLTLEQAIQDFSDADVWVGVSAKSLTELRAIDERHTWFSAYQSGRVYHLLQRSTATGANDFWEQGVVRPDLILQDFYHIFYPSSSSDSLYFAGKLKE